MDTVYEKYLPIGSVILVKDSEQRFMITGYLVIDNDKKDKVYDYSAVIYPVGTISSNSNIMLDHSNIRKVLFEGYIDNNAKKFLNELKEGGFNEKVQGKKEP